MPITDRNKATNEGSGDDMGKWAVKDGADDLFIVETFPDGTLSLHIPTPDPVLVTRKQAEQIRVFIGAAIASVCPAAPS